MNSSGKFIFPYWCEVIYEQAEPTLTADLLSWFDMASFYPQLDYSSSGCRIMTPQRPRYGDGKNKDWYSYTNSLDKCWQCTSCHEPKTSPADRKAGRATHAPTSSATPSSADTGRKRPPQNAVASLADTGRTPHPRAGDSKAAPSKAETHVDSEFKIPGFMIF